MRDLIPLIFEFHSQSQSHMCIATSCRLLSPFFVLSLVMGWSGIITEIWLFGFFQSSMKWARLFVIPTNTHFVSIFDDFQCTYNRKKFWGENEKRNLYFKVCSLNFSDWFWVILDRSLVVYVIGFVSLFPKEEEAMLAIFQHFGIWSCKGYWIKAAA